MAQSGREIQRRIHTVKNTQQITKAMEMIAAAKLRKAQVRVENSRPFSDKLKTSLTRVLAEAGKIGDSLPKLAQMTGKKRACLLVIGADRGLSGSYNANIIRQAESVLQENPGTYMVLVGKRVRDYFRRQGQEFLADYVYLGDYPNIHQAQEISRLMQEFYLNDLFDCVKILYTKFISSSSYKVVSEQVLPLATENADTQEEASLESIAEVGAKALYLYEPSLDQVLKAMIPLYVDTRVFIALLEAAASRQSATMVAMHNATENAAELLNELNLTFNRIRQGAITTEISEIVGGAEALK